MLIYKEYNRKYYGRKESFDLTPTNYNTIFCYYSIMNFIIFAVPYEDFIIYQKNK